MFNLILTTRFRKDVKLLKRRGYDMKLLKIAIQSLEESGQLPDENKPHKLSGDYNDYWEAHLKPDWLIIWKIIREDKNIWLTRTGTHSDLF